MPALTVAEALQLDVLRSAEPEVIAGQGGLDRPVRWVHSTELADIAPLLRRDDLLLSTGIALSDCDDGLRKFAQSLDESGCAGIVLELGRRWTTVPLSLVDECDHLGLPLVALHHEVRFAAVAQAIGEHIVNHQIAELREAHEVHETFTDLSISEAGPDEILGAVQRLAGSTVVLEGTDHQVIDFRAGPSGAQTFMADWRTRSRSVALESRTTWNRRHGWLVTRLGRRDRGLGRLVVQSPDAPPQRLIAVIERGAAALAMHRLQDRHSSSQVRRAHQEILLGLMHDPTDSRILSRCEATGLPVQGVTYAGISLKPVTDGISSLTLAIDDVMAAIVHAAHVARCPVLVAESHQSVRVLLAAPPGKDVDRVVDEIVGTATQRRDLVAGAGRSVSSISEVDRTLRESLHVLTSVKNETGGPVVHRLEDVHLRGLLALLVDDDRMRLFVERELAAVWRHDAEHGTEYAAVLEALLTYPSSKSDAAASLHLSRPVFYDRLSKVERVLGVDLNDPDVRVSLHVALVAAELDRSSRS